jgi:hypothetical protein
VVHGGDLCSRAADYRFCPTRDVHRELQPANGGFYDAFVAKLNASGSALLYSTYLGGNSNDYGRGIAVDGSGNAYVTGYTFSTNFPTASPLQPAFGGNDDAFIAKISPAAIMPNLQRETWMGR